VDRRLGIVGEDLAGSDSATEFVNWYNGHPDFATRTYDLATRRAVVIGNGNVALDVARILVTDPDDLATTDIAAHALAALRASAVREVVVLGRRGPREAAYSASELLALADLAGVDVRVEIPGVNAMGTLAAGGANLKERVAYELAGRRGQTANRLITLKFFSSPVEITGDTRVTGLAVARTRLESASDGGVQAVVTDDRSFIEAGLVLRSIGYRGRAIAGLPFDEDLAIVPNDHGRVVQRNGVMPGVYVTGWIKRGARGVIGTNRECARETVANLVADHRSGRLSAPTHDSGALADLVGERQPAAIGLDGWRSIDRAERDAGRAVGSPRRKLTGRAELLAAAEPATGDCPEP
jgi:ferredoxin--NADP+ reductase